MAHRDRAECVTHTRGGEAVSEWKSLWKSECGKTAPIYRVLVPDSVNEAVLRAWSARG